MRGGSRPGAGRKKGSKNVAITLGDAKGEAIASLASSGETPLEYMLRVMRDPTNEHTRRDKMAAAAAPYLHARLESVEQKIIGADGQPVTPTIILTGQPEPPPPP